MHGLKITSFVLATVLVGSLSCSWLSNEMTFIPETIPQAVTLDEANQSLGTRVPLPSYLPGNYSVREIDLVGGGIPILLISDKQIEKRPITDSSGNIQNYEITCRLLLKISWYPEEGAPGIKLPGPRVNINPVTGYTSGGIIYQPEDGSHKSLWWHWWPDPNTHEQFEIVLSASKYFSNKELVNIAESLSIDYQEPLVISNTPGKCPL